MNKSDGLQLNDLLSSLYFWRRRLVKRKLSAEKVDEIAKVLLFTSLLVEGLDANAQESQDQKPLASVDSQALSEKTDPDTECAPENSKNAHPDEKECKPERERTEHENIHEIDKNLDKIKAAQKHIKGHEKSGGGTSTNFIQDILHDISEATGFSPTTILAVLGGVAAAGAGGIALMGGGS